MKIRRKRYLKRRDKWGARVPGQTPKQGHRVKTKRRLSRLKPHYLQAPENFSLLDNPEGFCKFIAEVRNELQEYGKIEVNHEGVVAQTPEALTLFISVLADPRYRKAASSGLLPKDPKQRQMFLDSGICEHLRLNVPIYQSNNAGNIFRKRNYRVEPNIAASLKRFAMEKLYGQDQQHQALYRMLIELMANTHNHAKGQRDEAEQWWTSVYCQDQNRICFTFVDNGVGIFRSVGETMTGLKKLAQRLGIKNNLDFLRNLLKGELKSSTGLENRGKGIPMIYDLATKEKVENLTVITNDVFARVSANDLRPLKTEFVGTLWYWEIASPLERLIEVTT